MGRLRQLPSRLTALPSPLASSAPARREDGEAPRDQRSAERDAMQPWRRWYKTGRWQRLRWSVLERALFTCRRCGRIEVDTSRLVADHVAPHRGEEALFWEPANLQCLCKGCHDGAKQREERRGGG